MSRLEEKISKLNTPEAEAHLIRLYGPEQKTLAAQKARYSDLLRKFEATFRRICAGGAGSERHGS